MCGIAGWLGRDAERDTASMDGVLAALRHRGPDAHDLRCFPGAVLLHTRLSIIDLSSLGAQPMCNEDGTVWTVFNGELYNHGDIRQELEAKGHIFRGRSDTEIIPHLYEEMGADFPTWLRGMFAIAVYDTRERRLVLARDRFGIKPLFYATQSGAISFASELRALTLLPGINLSPDPQAIYDYAALFYIPAPETFYQGIRSLEPGEVLVAEHSDGRVTTRASHYHRWSIAPDERLTLDDAADRADSLIKAAVQRQLESDVPLGALLSGGIDSSLVSLHAQAASQDKLHTFNVRFSDEEFDETWAALAVAEQIGSVHTTLNMDDARGTWKYITELLLHVGQPYADTSLFAVNAVSRLMRRHVTVALSGDGGDEGFGGYDLYVRAPQFASLLAIPYPLRRAALHTLAIGLAPLVRSRLVAKHHLPYLVRDLANGADQTALVQKVFLWIREDEHMALCRGNGAQPIRRLFEPQWEYALPQGTPLLERISAHMTEANTRLTLASDYLPKVDTASMRNSLEVRVPMLDEDVFAFGLTLPHALKIKDGVGKQVLRAVARRRLPPRVANKPKWGFGIPVDQWTDVEFKSRLRRTLLDSRSPLAEYLRPEVYQPMVTAFCDGALHPAISRMGLYQRVIMLLSLHLFLDGGKENVHCV